MYATGVFITCSVIAQGLEHDLPGDGRAYEY